MRTQLFVMRRDFAGACMWENLPRESKYAVSFVEAAHNLEESPKLDSWACAHNSLCRSDPVEPKLGLNSSSNLSPSNRTLIPSSTRCRDRGSMVNFTFLRCKYLQRITFDTEVKFCASACLNIWPKVSLISPRALKLVPFTFWRVSTLSSDIYGECKDQYECLFWTILMLGAVSNHKPFQAPFVTPVDLEHAGTRVCTEVSKHMPHLRGRALGGKASSEWQVHNTSINNRRETPVNCICVQVS